MAKGFLSRMMYNNWLWILGLLLLLLSVVYHTLTNGASTGSLRTIFILEELPGIGGIVEALRNFFSNLVLKNAFSLVAVVIGAIIIQHFSSNNRLIRVRSFFPFFWYCVLAASLFPYVDQPSVYVAAILLVGACYRIFSVSEKMDMNRALFDASLLLALASIAFNRLTWLLPFFWLAASCVQSLSIRNVAASLVGFALLYWIIGGISYVQGDYRYLLSWLDGMWEFKLMDFSALSPIAVMYLIFMGLLFLISVGSFVQQQNQDKLTTRNNLYAVLILWLGGMSIWLTTSSSNTAVLFLLTIPTLIFFSHFFSLKDGLFTRVLFFVQLTCSLLAFFFYA